MIQRIFDIIFALLGLFFLLPVFLFISLLIKIDSKGSIFFKQIRVGKNKKLFNIIKFRTMRTTNNKTKYKLTIGEKDSRITGVGFLLRKCKLDEFPQLINVLSGSMSLVGPRPEVPEYVEHYTKEEMKIISLKPGITDLASIEYINENKILAKSKDPEKDYIEKIMREKIKLNYYYLENYNFKTYLRIILLTLKKIVSTN